MKLYSELDQQKEDLLVTEIRELSTMNGLILYWMPDLTKLMKIKTSNKV